MRRLAIVMVLLTATAFAKPPNPFLLPLKDWAFWTGTANFTASAVYDVHSTKACERNFTCVEAYKGHDRYSYIAPQIALMTAASYGCSLMLSEHKRWRVGCLAVTLAFSVQHWKDGATIYRNDLVARP